MEVIDAPIDDKAKRMRDLLSSFYSQDNSNSDPVDSSHASGRYATLDSINSTGFDADQYMNLLVSFVSSSVVTVIFVDLIFLIL